MNIPAGVFKVKCLKLMDDVKEFHKEFVITKRGKPVAKLVPVDEGQDAKVIFGYLREAITIKGDIVSSVGEVWNADK